MFSATCKGITVLSLSQGDSFEDLQRMFAEMVGGGDGRNFNLNENPTDKKRPRVDVPKGNPGKRAASRR